MTMTAIRNPAKLTHALAHHASQLQGAVGVLALGVLIELQPLGWELRQSGKGPNSFSLRRGGDQYHFRGRQSHPGPGGQIDVIVVNDAYQNGTTVYEIHGRVDALRFIADLVAKG